MCTKQKLWLLLGMENLEQVNTFPYLGSVFADDAECEKEIKGRLGKGYNVGVAMKKLWQSHDISIATKAKLMKTLTWTVATYSCESWTIKKRTKTKLMRWR